MRKLLLLLAVTALLPLMAYEADFTQGRVKNFWTAVFKKSAYEKNTGLKFEGNGRIHAAKLQLDAAKIPVIELRSIGELKLAKLYYAAETEPFAENRMVRGRISGDRVFFELDGKRGWTGTISQLRFDVYPADKKGIVKSIRFAEIVPGMPQPVDFTTGSMHRWRLILAKKGTTAVSGKGIVMSATGKERLLSPKMKIDTAKCDIIEVRLTGECPTVKLYFTGGKEPLSESKMVRGKRRGEVMIFDMSKNRHWTGEVNSLRLDFYAPVENEIEVKTIDFSKGEGANALHSPWRKPVELAPGAVVTGSCEVLSPVPAGLVVSATGKVVLNVKYLDVYGKSLRAAEFGLNPGKIAVELSFEKRTAQLQFAVRNPGSKTVNFSMKAMMVPPPQKTAQTVYSVKLADVPADSTEKTVWTPQVTFSPAVPAGKRFTLILKSAAGAEIVAADTELTAAGAALTTDKLHFAYLNPGKYTVTAAVDGVPCQLPEYTINHTRQSQTALPQVKIDRSGNRPQYIINGTEKVNTMEYLGSDPPLSQFAYRQIFNAIDNGIDGIRLRVIFRFDEQNKVDFKEVDEALQTILMRRPGTNIMFHVSVTDPGPKWRGAHPEEGIRNEKGEFHVLNYRKTPEATSSMASKRWVQDSVTMLKSLIDHLKRVPGGNRVIGVLPCSGITWEWLHWGSAQGEFVDYSEHYRQFFIGYLREIYHNDIARLNAAWQSSYKSFADVQIPAPARRLAADHTEFRSPAAFQPEIDLTDSLSHLVSEVIITLCKAVKTASDGKLLTGTYYGYNLYLNAARRAQETGHFALTRVLEVPEIDIIMAPSRYAGRNIGGATGFMYPEGSLALHGKLNISECDDRPINASSATGRADTVAGSRAALERAYGLQNAGYSVMRWFDFSKGWVMAEPRMLDVVKKLNAFDKVSGMDKKVVMPVDATAAVFTAERSAAVLKPDSKLQMMLQQDGYEQLAASGMSFSFFNIADLSAAEQGRKLLMFMNCFRLSETEKAAVRTAVAVPGRVYFFTGGIGLFENGKLSDRFMREILGCEFIHAPERKLCLAQTTVEAEKLLGIPAGSRLRAAQECGDIFYPTGKNVIPLAKNRDGMTTLAAIRKNGSLFIYSAYPALSNELFRKLAVKSGLPVVHAGNAAVWYNYGYCTIHSAKPVTAVVELPAGFKGVRMFPDMRFIPAKDGRVTCDLPAEATVIMQLAK